MKSLKLTFSPRLVQVAVQGISSTSSRAESRYRYLHPCELRGRQRAHPTFGSQRNEGDTCGRRPPEHRAVCKLIRRPDSQCGVESESCASPVRRTAV